MIMLETLLAEVHAVLVVNQTSIYNITSRSTPQRHCSGRSQ